MYTQIDLESVERAIVQLQNGERVANVRYGDASVQYAAVNLNELLELRTRIKSLLSNKPAIRQMTFSTSKGLR